MLRDIDWKTIGCIPLLICGLIAAFAPDNNSPANLDKARTVGTINYSSGKTVSIVQVGKVCRIDSNGNNIGEGDIVPCPK